MTDLCSNDEVMVLSPDNDPTGALAVGASTSTPKLEITEVIDTDSIVLIDNPYSVVGGFGGRKPRNVDFHRGDFTFVQPGVSSSSVAKTSGSLIYLDFASSFRKSLEDELNPRVKLDEPRTATSGLLTSDMYISMLKNFMQNDGYGGRLRIESILTLLLTDIYQLLDKSGQETADCTLQPAKLASIREFVDSHIDEKIDVQTLASLANVSQFHFARVFKASTGLSPYQYVLQHRLDKARQLLVSTKLSIVEIAFTTGFSSQSHMSAAFRNYFGVSPGRYRKELML